MDPHFNILKGVCVTGQENTESQGKLGFSINPDLLPTESAVLSELEQEIEDEKALALALRVYEVKKNKRLNISVHVMLTFTCQLVLAAMTFHELATND